MKRATITLPDDLETRVDAYLDRLEPKPSLTALVQAALRRYLDEDEWARRGFKPARGPLRITPAPEGSGHSDTSERHDEVLAESERS